MKRQFITTFASAAALVAAAGLSTAANAQATDTSDVEGTIQAEPDIAVELPSGPVTVTPATETEAQMEQELDAGMQTDVEVDIETTSDADVEMTYNPLNGETIVDAASEAENLTTLTKAISAAGLADALKEKGPFTVFAPDNDAFAAIPQDDFDALLAEENKAQLKAVLRTHVLMGDWDAERLITTINETGGSAELVTITGDVLTASLDGDAVILTDPAGASVTVTATDMKQSNGIVHVIDGVLMPGEQPTN